MAHGTPESIDQMAEYLRLVRGGREPLEELIDEMIHRWRAIGGRSPLTDITLQQGSALQALLAGVGVTARVAVGMRNWKPSIADAVRGLCTPRVARVIGIPLALQFSTLSVQKYIDAAKAALSSDVVFSCVQTFHDHLLLIEAFAEKVRAAAPAGGEEVVFTAHSLPQRVAQADDPYPDEVATTARLVVAQSGVGAYLRAYQRAGRTPEPWLGPDLSELIRAHAGVALRCTQSLNTSPTFIKALAALVTQEAASPA